MSIITLNVNRLNIQIKTDTFDATIYLPVLILVYKSDVSDVGFFSIFSSKNLYVGDKEYNGFFLNDENKIESVYEGVKFVDLSITKNVFAMIFSFILLVLIMLKCSSWYSKHGCTESPKGFVGIIECVIIYMCDNVFVPNIGNKYKKFFPFLITLFFFILINNLLGLLPGSANVTGDISVTACLAFLTFLYTNLNSTKHYWHHIFAPETPKFLYPIMVPIEVADIFIKPFTLLIRLFANMTSGHIVLLSIINLAFVFQSYAVGVCGVVVSVFMVFLKLLVAFLQAYIFTLLSSIYIGGAVKESSH